ncbi:DNA repair protein HhH-GPD [Alicyclobacillus contaminans]|uniref:type II toxin-antitoxin system HicB family antitoxin n=1 Tax=Alicyclobacillus contaminans TaxID=392016 RepID=UPI0004017331|nr:DNA repair protein HhH-GPD [Alicyclobacillus contaminans]
MEKDLEYYMDLPYSVVLHPDPTGEYVVEIPDLPGCLSQGETIEEALRMIEDAKRAWIEIALEEGRSIPEPSNTGEFSGKFNVRVPKSLHKVLVENARREGVSLNQYIIYQLSKNVGLEQYEHRS